MYVNEQNALINTELKQVDFTNELTCEIREERYLIVAMFWNYQRVTFPNLTPMELYTTCSPFFDGNIIEPNHLNIGMKTLSFNLSEISYSNAFSQGSNNQLFDAPIHDFDLQSTLRVQYDIADEEYQVREYNSLTNTWDFSNKAFKQAVGDGVLLQAGSLFFMFSNFSPFMNDRHIYVCTKTNRYRCTFETYFLNHKLYDVVYPNAIKLEDAGDIANHCIISTLPFR